MATSITLTTNAASTEYTLASGWRGPAGATGTSLTAGTGIDITEGVVSSTVTGNATHTGDATGSTALTLATVNGNIGSFTNASITVNAKGLVTAASSGASPVTSVTGTAGMIKVVGTTDPVLSLPSSLYGLGSVSASTFVGALTGNATTVTTNANLTGPVTSTGNATAIANGAISNAMLANGAVTNLSGTNTGDETAARIATALNAGTEDSTAADTDKLAVTHPAGGWMLLSTLWTWITGKIDTLAKLDAIVADATLARTDAGQTFAGAQAFSSTTRPTSSATTGTLAAADAQSLITKGDGDVRYGPIIKAICTVQTDNNTTTLTDITGMTGVALEADTLYRVELWGTVTCLVGGGYRIDLISDVAFPYPLGSDGSFIVVPVGANIGSGNQATWISTTRLALNYRTVASSNNPFSSAGYFKTPSSAPTVKLQMFQNTGPSGTTSIHPGTIIVFTKIN